MKRAQSVMVWFLPLIVIGGLFYPLLGYLVLAMMAFFLTLSFFRARFWCWNLCPRGAFLDMAISKVSRNGPLPRIFSRQWFRWTVFILFLVFLALRIVRSGGSLAGVGSVFVGMCLLTTVIAIVLGIITRHRGWCAVCPMGTLQETIGKLGRKRKGV